jgi:hypothetical protein
MSRLCRGDPLRHVATSGRVVVPASDHGRYVDRAASVGWVGWAHPLVAELAGVMLTAAAWGAVIGVWRQAAKEAMAGTWLASDPFRWQ